ncbi:uncharacterized protein HMPREF1541_03905 [Cyphellophora europaea CBS 101466]|uniref:Uncharacterized protein n=1 Tax=Cyphellophora europaea (strain CBS 101466) TaxID=1220924 RepID=W2RZR2_CYPE1|nr:uncharacterized protein HMPREF1541_03905 [Cyphellophora europaea CBS 101466]ETN41966.1 hypothetical protein HMPREF1541_03905 [Cyphellophora europaea CBS 101466]
MTNVRQWHSAHQDQGLTAAAQSWRPSKTESREYAPFTTRTPWLVTLLVVILGCIAALETAFHSGVDADDPNDSATLARRQEDSTTLPEFSILTTTDSEPTITTSIEPSTTVIPSTTSTPTTSAVTSPTTSGPTTSRVASPTTSRDSTSPTEITASYANPDGFITNKTPTTSRSNDVTAASTDEDAHITNATPTTSLSPDPPVTESADPESFITTDAPSGETLHLTVVTVSPETATQVTTDSMGSTVTNTVVVSVSSTVTTSEIISNGLVTLAISPTVLTTVIGGETQVISTSTTVTAPASSSTPTAPAGVKSSQVQISKTYKDHDFFLSSYLAVLVAVLLKLTWGLVFSGLKMLEPFYQLSKPGGATPSESLLADYLSAAYGWTHIRHIFSGHWVMLFSTFAYIAMATLSPIASESMATVATQFCPQPSGIMQPCSPVWVINKGPARALEGILIAVAVLIILVIVFNFRRKSGIHSNPSSIATMASLLSHDDMLQDLRQLDPSASDKSILAALSGTRYVLTSYTDATGLPRYGITKSTSSMTSNPYSLGSANNFDASSRHQYAALTNPNNMSLQEYPIREQKPFSVSWRLVRDAIFILVILALFGIVLAYYLVGNRSAFNNWFNSGGFGPKFTLTLIAALIDFGWKTLEREVRILAPYRRLGARRARADKSVLVDVAGVPLSALWGAMRRGEVFHSIVAVTAILSDVLIITVGGVPFSQGRFFDAYLYSSYISLAILGWMVLVMLAVFWWRAQVKRLRLPREPDTILSVWLMMADEGNGLLREYGGWETTRGAERDRAAKRRGAIYSGGWMKVEDGSERWCISVDDGVAGGGGGGGGSLVSYDYGTVRY